MCYGFAQQLYPVPQGMFNDQSAAFGAGIDRQIFYSVKDGVWNDISVWETVSQKVGRLPTIIDDVYIRHTITLNDVNHVCYNLFVSGILKPTYFQAVLSVYGDVKSTGLIDFTASGFTAPRIDFYGQLLNSDLNDGHYLAGSTLIRYMYAGQEWVKILPLTYYSISCNGNQYADFDLNIGGLFQYKNFDLRNINSSINSIQINNVDTLFKHNGGSIIISGATSTSGGSAFIFDGNPNLEFRGNAAMLLSTGSNFGTGVIKFNTANQTLSLVSVLINTNMTIEDIVLTLTGTIQLGSGANFNGISVASQLIIGNGGRLVFNWDAPYPMSTGTFNHMAVSGSYIGYGMTTDYTIPLTTFMGLYLINGGTKTLLAGSVVNEQLQATNTSAALAGNVTIIGLLTLSGGNFTLNGFTAELRGGATSSSRPYSTIFAGTLLLSTNNQSFYIGTVNADMTINGITVTTGYNNGENNIITMNGVLDGTGTLVNGNSGAISTAHFDYKNASRPMSLGTLNCNSIANIFKYNMAGNQDVTGTTYRTLEFGGSGVKTLQGNVVVNTTAGGSWSITGTATVNMNGFTITTI